MDSTEGFNIIIKSEDINARVHSVTQKTVKYSGMFVNVHQAELTMIIT